MFKEVLILKQECPLTLCVVRGWTPLDAGHFKSHISNPELSNDPLQHWLPKPI